MIRLDGRARYAVAGQAGTWRYVGQATYVDEATGVTVDHDHVRMARVGQDDAEVWVDPGEVTPVTATSAGAA